MSLLLNEEQRALRDTAKRFVSERMPTTLLRRLRDERDPDGFSRAAWKEMAGLGLVGLTLPEEYGGAGLGYAELGVLFEECGRTLAPTPLLATSVLGAEALLRAGTPAQKAAWLPRVAAGEALLALALDEGTQHRRYTVETRAERERGTQQLRLRGHKSFVLDGHVADALVVVARTAGERSAREGLSLFLVPRDARGLTVVRTHVIDSRNVAELRFEDVLVSELSRLGTLDGAADVLDAVLDRAAIVLSAEMLGSAQEAFERTLSYLKERRQFGVPIGSFQALKHRAALMFCELELARSIVLDALRAIDEARSDVPVVASVAKARLSDVFRRVAAEAVQMHGGIGVTDELDIGFFYKRAMVAAMSFGNAEYHRDRYATLRGY